MLLRGVVVRSRSPKRAKQEREYARLRHVFLEAHPRCEFRDADACLLWATDVHHRRGRVGALLTDTRYWSALCRPHHRYVTEHPAKAYELGISERRIGGAA